MESRKNIFKKVNFAPYIMILPIMVLLAIFAFYPLALSIIKSTYRWSGTFDNDTGINTFIGFKNYVELFSDKIFLESWLNTLFFVFTGVAVNLVFPFLCALLIFSIKNEKTSYRWRVAFVAPMVVPSMVVFLLWQFIYDVDVGVINNVLKLLNLSKVDLLGRPESVKWAIRFMGFPWVGGTFLLVYIAGLSSIDNSLREAARIDGASPLRTILAIDIPLSKPQFKMVLTLSVIGEIQDFVKIQTVTEGGPGYSSYVPGLYMYKMAFDSNEYGKACAIGVTMLIVMLLVSFAINKLFKTESAD
ncbi:MAG: sugar ABC transporter permease [Clostridia bacterium]|nr:sugar ABC transporter permease [Clostridia bacterium]